MATTKALVRDASASLRRPEDILATRHRARITKRRALGYRDISLPIIDLERLIEVVLIKIGAPSCRAAVGSRRVAR